MDPNNNQPLGTSPVQQAAPQPVVAPAQPVPAPSQPVVPTSPQNVSENPKKGMGKGMILLVILLLLVLGIVSYVLFAKNQMNNIQKTTTDNNSSVLPSPTLVPTLTPEEDLEVGSPEGDLLELDANVKDL